MNRNARHSVYYVARFRFMSTMTHCAKTLSAVLLALLAGAASSLAGGNPGAAEFHAKIRPLLENYCFDCHGDGAHKGNIAFDELKTDQSILTNRDLWWKAMKNLRAGMMPPAKKPRPTAEQEQEITQWIKTAVFNANPQNPDPGRITLRRLNRAEYHNTIRDLMGVDFDTQQQFPPDDTGFGFDTIADVLTLPPMLLEKYMNAAQKIVAQAVPQSKDDKHKNYRRFFPKDVPAGSSERRMYARELLSKFAGKAFRRPVDKTTVSRLADLAEDIYTKKDKTFETGIAEGMVAVLSSSRFLFREESTEPKSAHGGYALVDEYSLASRMSYFLWSTMPDDELMSLAAAGQLRQNLSQQTDRMLDDRRSKEFVRNFTGQWLRARDIDNVQIDSRAVMQRERGSDPEMEHLRRRFHELEDKGEEQFTAAEKVEFANIRTNFFKKFNRTLRPTLTPELRRSMRDETEDVFSYVIHQNRSLLELIDSDYTFLNERLAHQYGITNVTGEEMRRVVLPPGSPRGGILTEGTVLAVTSNPTRTSPVKRGLFILDNILGTPPAPPPANLPPLEDAAKGLSHSDPSLREILAAHRASPLCASCHNRMDPLGLAMENFNALGLWRDSEFKKTIAVEGTLLTGESFTNFTQVKQILVKNHAEDFYRTLTEKMLTYALGRGLDYYDVETVDEIVSRIEKSNGRPSALLAGIMESAPFEKCRLRGEAPRSTMPVKFAPPPVN
ncbi:MAG TPA: DUF1592 domain-containing protein [Verrucomicrobiae bacterium]|jgi:hypothetical protein